MLFSGLLAACVVDLDKLFCSVPWAMVRCSLIPVLCGTKSPGSTFSSNKPHHMIACLCWPYAVADGRTLPGEAQLCAELELAE